MMRLLMVGSYQCLRVLILQRPSDIEEEVEEQHHARVCRTQNVVGEQRRMTVNSWTVSGCDGDDCVLEDSRHSVCLGGVRDSI